MTFLSKTAATLFFMLGSFEAVVAETISFGVYSDAECKVALFGEDHVGSRALPSEPGGCNTFSYESIDGRNQTNSEDMFNCCENFVEFMQYAGSETCGEGSEGKTIYNLMTSDCDYVATSSGDTWQLLINYTRCSQRTNYNGKYGSNITEEQCNDPNFVPVGGSWEYKAANNDTTTAKTATSGATRCSFILSAVFLMAMAIYH